jgi:hypothetical protein
MFLLINTETRKYVARPGHEHSYTKKLEEAQVFRTRAKPRPGPFLETDPKESQICSCFCTSLCRARWC